MISLLEQKNPKLIEESSNNSTDFTLSQQTINGYILSNYDTLNELKKRNLELIGKIDSKFYLIKKLGKGSYSKVYLGLSIEQFENKNKNDEIKFYSIKVINPMKSDVSLFKNEVHFLEKINHDNILKIYEYGAGIKSEIKNEKIKTKKIFYIVTEYLEHGELLNYITKVSPFESKGFGEDLGKLIFSQLLDGLEEIHSKNIFHRDIKLENVMLGSDYKFKFVDFGFCTDEIGLLNTYLGTPSYAAPELHLKRGYYGKSEDIFSLGVTLFIIVTGSLPFKLAVPNDTFYQFIIKNNYVSFWEKRMVDVSPTFMELFDNMIAFDYTQRPSISEIRQSPWMKNINYKLLPLLKKELNFREEIINKMKLNESEQKLSLLEIRSDINNNSFNIKLNEEKKNNCKEIKIINENINISDSNKGSIRVKFESNNINIALNKLKKYFNNKGYNKITINANRFCMQISKNEIDIVLKLEKNNHMYIKLNYYKIKGTKVNFDNFKKQIYLLRDKAL